MEKYYVIDFETYYDKDCTVSSLGYIAYTQHPKFDAYMVSIWGEDIQYVGTPEEAPWHKIDGKLWISHNAAFDIAVYNSLRIPYETGLDKVYYREVIQPSRWLDSAAMCAYCKYPRSLSGAAEELLGQEVDKSIRSNLKGVSREDLLADEERYEETKEYCLNDARITYTIVDQLLSSWPEHERKLSEWTIDATLYGYRVDPEEIDKALMSLELQKETILNKIPWMIDPQYQDLMCKTLGKSKLYKIDYPKPCSVRYLNLYCKHHKLPYPGSLDASNPAYLKWVEKYGKEHECVAMMSDFRSINTFEKKVDTIRKRIVMIDGEARFHAGLMYFGAHTGRWSGSTGFNEQNLPRSEMYGVDLRSFLKPKEGHKFVIVDLAQIEPRCLAMIAKDKAMLHFLQSGQSPYEAHARASMGWEGGKLKEENAKLYLLAKARVLALGYQCGGDKFIVMAKQYANLDLDREEARMMVQDFRDSNQGIVNVWNKIQDRIKTSVGSELTLTLPSKRTLSYFNVTSNMVEKWGKLIPEYKASTSHGGSEEYIYGGKLTENLIQAFARDVMASGLLRLIAAGYRVIVTIHDEFVVEVPEETAEDDLKEVIKLVTMSPPWAPGLPLEAEGGIYDNYVK